MSYNFKRNVARRIAVIKSLFIAIEEEKIKEDWKEYLKVMKVKK